ncbi:MAG: MFS transporter [Exilispira sp.]
MRKTVNKLFRYLSSFNKTVWLLVFATFMESFGRFLVIPYLSIYLSRKGVSLPSIGAVIGMGPLAAVIFSIIGGHLSDAFGRKPVQIIGVLLSGISFLGFAISGLNLILLAFFNFFTTMTRTFYRPAVNAAIADITPPEKRSEALSLSRVSINLAYGLAPIVGVYLASREKPVAFIIGAIISFLVALFIAITVPETAIGIERNKYEKDENYKEKIYI